MRRGTVVFALALAVPVALAPARAADEEARALYVTAREVHVGNGEVFRPGAIAIENGKVVAVGRPEEVAVPEGARRLDGAAVIPGLVAASTEHVARGPDDDPATVAPETRAIDGYDFQADEAPLLAGGVTTAFLSPGSRRVVSGRGAVVKLAGASASERTLRADAGIVAGVGDRVNRPPPVIDPPITPDATAHPLLPHRRQLPVTRAGSILLLRQLVARARGGEGALAEMSDGRATTWIGADTAGDLEAAVAFAREANLQVTLVGARDAHAVIPLLREAKFPVVLHWPGDPGRVTAPADADAARAELAARRNAALLADAGVQFALATDDETSLADLLFVAASAAAEGLAPERALAAVTGDAARILGVADRVGTLEPGRDGDLVLLSGPPTDLRTFPRSTVVSGRVVWERKGGDRTVVVRAAQVHVGDGRVFAPGEVAIEDGRILEVGAAVGIPPGARFVDLGAGSITPGWIDAFSHAGRAGAGASTGGGVGGELSTALTAASAWTPEDASWELLRSRGVTAVLTAPGGGGRRARRAAILKSGGPASARVLLDDAGLVIRLSGDRDLAAAVAEVEGALKKARAYRESLEKYEKEKKEYDAWKKTHDEEEAKRKAALAAKPAETPKPAEGAKKEGEGGQPAEAQEQKKEPEKKEPEKTAEKPAPEEKEEPRKPRTDEALAGWGHVLDKTVPVLVRARTVEEIRAALKLLVDESKLRVIVGGGDDARRLGPALSKAKVGVIASPLVLAQDRTGPVNLLRELALSHLPCAVGSDSWLGAAELHDLVAYAVARGLSPAAAVRLLTGDAAKLLGVDGRIGLLEPGRDADLVLLTGEPFGAGSGIHSVYVGGQEVFRAK